MTTSKVIPIKPADPEGPADVLNPFRKVFDDLYPILAELSCAGAILSNADQPTELELRAAHLLHRSVKRLDALYDRFDGAIIEVKNTLEARNG